MRINPRDLARHLSRIRIPGPPEKEIRKVTLGGRFESTTATRDASLVVIAPPLAGVEELPEEVAVDLETLIGTLRTSLFYRKEIVPGLGGEKRIPLPVDLVLTDERLLLSAEESESGGVVELLRFTNADHDIMSKYAAKVIVRVEEGAESASLDFAPAEDWTGLPAPGAEGEAKKWTEQAGKTVGASRARAVILQCGRKEASLSGPIGDEEEGEFRIPIPLRSEKPYKLTFPSRSVVYVLDLLRKSKGVQIRVAGSTGPVLFTTEDGFRYLLQAKEGARTLLIST
jgi:hypothetical protein